MHDQPTADLLQMSNLLYFTNDQIETINQAIILAEELISDHFKISFSEWKRYRYDLKTLKTLKPEEITEKAFAQIIKYVCNPEKKLRGGLHTDYYKICLQDHVILKALSREKGLPLLPLAAYIVTHELIHVVRFSKFLQSFLVTPEEQEKEEALVHTLTHKLLKGVKIPRLSYVLHIYGHYKNMETFRAAE